MRKGINYKKLGLSFLMVFAAAFIGSVFTFSEIPTWYASLNKPRITPPNWLFSPMWTSLYTLMIISFYIIWANYEKHKDFKLARNLFIIQLILNAFWSIMFFGLHELVLALVVIIFLDFFVLANIIEFRNIEKRAGYLLLPYIAWLTAATILNLTIALIN